MTVHEAGVSDTSIIAAPGLYDLAELPETFLVAANRHSSHFHMTSTPARFYDQICAAARATGRQPRKRASDLMMAATATSNTLPNHTANQMISSEQRSSEPG